MTDYSAHEDMNERRHLKKGYLDVFGPGTAGYAAVQHQMKHARMYDRSIRTHDEALISLGMHIAIDNILAYLELEPDEIVRYSYRYYVQKQHGE